eukprot:CAMPEP_0202972878 /NCGR_PEP_ID=MMETSP1396-20130829/43114_1 /ASSEMBLY_ACC=CAM_ASM_000872 /TAXON_ID= /ORGANISM="Pseudokeronopsis sp., Strain Brazil" /LENGTH=63 /DNA_ID=CAMNT_0049703979 /DNA_START=63 /DNA_END=254 /DNA_ORIENTATION=-
MKLDKEKALEKVKTLSTKIYLKMEEEKKETTMKEFKNELEQKIQKKELAKTKYKPKLELMTVG